MRLTAMFENARLAGLFSARLPEAVAGGLQPTNRTRGSGEEST